METPLLKSLIGAYFHEDFIEVHGGMWETVDAFINDGPSDAGPLAIEIDEVLATLDDQELKRLLRSLGCSYSAYDFEGSYRLWLEGVARHLRDYIAKQN